MRRALWRTGAKLQRSLDEALDRCNAVAVLENGYFWGAEDG
jgi:hypothetical protein